MASKCVNYKCKSKRSKLVQAPETVCNYYNIPFKSYRVVCGICLKKCILHCKEMGKQINNIQCIFDNEFSLNHEYIDLSNEEENVASNEHPQEKQLSNTLETIIQDMGLPSLINKQKVKYQNYLDTQRCAIIAEDKQVTELFNEIENDFDHLFKRIYRFDNQRKFEFDKEVNIVDIKEKFKIVDNNEQVNIRDNDKQIPIIDISDESESTPLANNVHENESTRHLPPKGRPRRRLLKSGDKIFAQKLSQFQPWYEATVQLAVSDTYFSISFCDNGETEVLSNKKLAYLQTSNVQYPIGSRIIAKFKDVNIKMTDNFYVGIIAELPNNFNNYRFIF